MSLYHTKFLVNKALQNNSTLSSIEEKEEGQLSFNERFLQFAESKRSFTAASWTLSVISYSEVAVEMILNRRVSKGSKWKCVASLEGLK